MMRIREHRERLGLSQREVAASMGVAQNCVSQWETEVALPRVRQLPLLAQVLHCAISDLFAADAEQLPDEGIEL